MNFCGINGTNIVLGFSMMIVGTITGTKLDRLGAKLDKQVAVADLVLSSFLFKLTSTNYLDSCRHYVLLSNLVTGMVLSST